MKEKDNLKQTKKDMTKIIQIAELQIRGGIEGNLKIMFLISPQKHML